jgi:Zn-dependent peptidase ImmA (M78 family)/DNA-binding XRE family transcriptional regulator
MTGNETLFQPQRLELARLRRGCNKTTLAKKASLTAQTITAYEQARTEPSSEIVDRLAAALDFPVEFFYAEMGDVVPLNAASFRALSKMTKTQENAALAGGTMCIELSEWIDAEFHLPTPDVPDLDPGIITPEGAAALVRSEWGLGEAPISNVLHLVEAHGVRVFALAAEYQQVDAFSFWREETNTPYICVGTHKTPERGVFDLAHELGHLVLHRDHGAPRGRAQEREADNFASNFLMPKADIAAYAPQFPTLDDLVRAKGRWRVSAAALAYRLHKLNRISDWHYRSLCIEIGRLGRAVEQNSIPREQSQVLSKVLTELRREGIGRAQIAARLNFYPADLDALLSGLVVSSLEGEGNSVDHPRPSLRLVQPL